MLWKKKTKNFNLLPLFLFDFFARLGFFPILDGVIAWLTDPEEGSQMLFRDPPQQLGMVLQQVLMDLF